MIVHVLPPACQVTNLFKMAKNHSNSSQTDQNGWLREWIQGKREENFDQAARRIFQHQYHQIPPYKRYADHLNLTPNNITHWKEIPAVPTNAFKDPNNPLTSGISPAKTFLTSGTTGETRGAHHFPETSLYELAIDHGWPLLQLPKLPTFFLTPSAEEAPQSSLSHMFAHLNNGAGERFLIRDNKFHLQPLYHHLTTNKPLILMGTALAFLHLMETLGPIPLPAGSHLLETGGYKGTTHTLSKETLYQDLASHFSLPLDHLHNEYGMTELSSQAYSTGPNGAHRYPHWVRYQILDPETNAELPPGELGYLIIYDLANLHTVSAIRTQDLAIGHPDGSFTLIGRDPSALPRGCSRSIDEALTKTH